MSYHICVSGAAGGDSVEQSRKEAEAIGRAIAESGNVLLTGATVGLPNYAAIGCKKAGGTSIGISPAATKLEHVKKYRLPTEHYDFILYTGLHYIGRDALLVNSSDGVVSLGGRIGTLHEFTVAMETETPIGFLTGTGGVTEMIEEILDRAGRKFYQDVMYDEDPEKLVKQVIKRLDEEHANHPELHVGQQKDRKAATNRKG